MKDSQNLDSFLDETIKNHVLLHGKSAHFGPMYTPSFPQSWILCKQPEFFFEQMKNSLLGGCASARQVAIDFLNVQPGERR